MSRLTANVPMTIQLEEFRSISRSPIDRFTNRARKSRGGGSHVIRHIANRNGSNPFLREMLSRGGKKEMQIALILSAADHK